MATRYLIGKGELLTHPIEAPRIKPGPKLRPYTLDETREALLPQIESANELFASLPSKACPRDLVVARVAIHPAFLAKSYFPKALLDQAGLASVGSHTVRIKPKKTVHKSAEGEVETTEIYVAGTRSILRNFPSFVNQLTPEMTSGICFSEIESFAPMVGQDRLRTIPDLETKVFEVGLHLIPEASDDDTRGLFADYAKDCGFIVNPEFAFPAGGLLFLAVQGDLSGLQQLSNFSMMRVVRPMPKLRGVRPMTRSIGVSVQFHLPSGEPLSKEPRVAVLDGGLPQEHVLHDYIRRYRVADPSATDVPEYLEHGLGVTSALLFGPIEPEGVASRPFSLVDHYRVLDARSDEEDPYELYRTLANIEEVLLSRQYQFINLSLGPDMAIEDSDVHAWTSVIDNILSDGETLMSIAVGNNGQRDELTGLNRIQVPADCVNALSIGATDRSSEGWSRALYSAKGPGRSPGRRKPDLVAFGGSPKEYFHVAGPGLRLEAVATLGTSFAAPLALRSAIGVRAVLGDAVHPLTTKGLLVHGCESEAHHRPFEVGWGKIPEILDRLITCADGVARIIYQGQLLPGKFLRAQVPLPRKDLTGKVTLRATFCYASPVDPQDAAAYTKAGLGITFRPHRDRKLPGSANAKPRAFFPASDYRNEAELRADLGKWETVLHAEETFYGTSLLDPVFDIHYNAREAGGLAAYGARPIRYALVLTVIAPKHPDLHQEILDAHNVLQALIPQIAIPIRL